MTVVGPITSTTVPMVYDSDSGGFGGPLDMNGPVVGSVSYKQTNADDLHISIALDFGQPNTRYEVFLTCGPAHALACGFRGIAVLTTDAVGAAGNTSATVPFGVLEAAPFGPGYRTDHLDLLHALGDL